MNSGGPFGKYAAIVAAFVAILIVLAWASANLGFTNPSASAASTINDAFWTVVGVTIGTGAGAAVVSNGLGKQTEAAHTRLDAIGAPSEQVAAKIVEQTKHDANA